jgi:hypothetical protein
MTIGTKLYSRGLFVVAFLVLIATNALVLKRVAANRSGTPESQLTLTERELGLGYRVFEENSGLSLHLSWRTVSRDERDSHGYWRSPEWFDARKLAALGFNLERFEGDGGYNPQYKEAIPKEVYLVLELGGAPYQASVWRAQTRLDTAAPDDREDRERELGRERRESSRLFAIDAGLDPLTLREAYGDRQRYLIARGLVEPRNVSYEEKKEVGGYIKKLSIEKVHVPLELRPFFEGLPARTSYDKDLIRTPRYQVTLAYGKRFEPWIVAVKSMDEASIEIEESIENEGSEENEGPDGIDYIGRR